MIGYDNIWCLDGKTKLFTQANRANIKGEIKINIFYVQEKRSSLMFHVSVQLIHTPGVRQINSI